ncbi:MAG: hypothetical protein KKD39_05745, partial [Candidatus Altiarchaeota archaeon]|nr:hypothetical protein [Candidatus Altiarchaeota archaeon]
MLPKYIFSTLPDIQSAIRYIDKVVVVVSYTVEEVDDVEVVEDDVEVVTGKVDVDSTKVDVDPCKVDVDSTKVDVD